jgi:hypothetical protein
MRIATAQLDCGRRSRRQAAHIAGAWLAQRGGADLLVTPEPRFADILLKTCC